MLQVDVRAGDTSVRPCGSAFDVIAGRSGWGTWRAQDLGDPTVNGAGVVSSVPSRTRSKYGALTDAFVDREAGDAT